MLLHNKIKCYGFIIIIGVDVVVREYERALEVAVLPRLALAVEVVLEVVYKLLNGDAAIIICIVQRELVVILLPEAVMRRREHRVQLVAIGRNVHHPVLLAAWWRHHQEAHALGCITINKM